MITKKEREAYKQTAKKGGSVTQNIGSQTSSSNPSSNTSLTEPVSATTTITTTDTTEKIESFFKDPDEEQELPGKFSTLYLLRRDINQCFKNSILWPTTMCILAGFDLLGKFHAGNDDRGQVGKRFQEFLRAFVLENLENKKEVEVLYSLRNSMCHSFGLYDNKYHIVLNRDKTKFISPQSKTDKKYRISVYLLKEKFENGIENFKKTLTKPDKIAKFDRMFDKYGSIWIEY
jgi:hypothetical protein